MYKRVSVFFRVFIFGADEARAETYLLVAARLRRVIISHASSSSLRNEACARTRTEPATRLGQSDPQSAIGRPPGWGLYTHDMPTARVAPGVARSVRCAADAFGLGRPIAARLLRTRRPDLDGPYPHPNPPDSRESI